MEPELFDLLGMAKSAKRQEERVPLYIGEWIARLGLKQKDVAKDAGIGESHLSNIKTEGRQDPSYSTLYRIADAMGVTVDDLRHPPPAASTVAAVEKLSPKAQEALFGRRRDQ